MICRKCGTLQSDYALFCGTCGTRLERGVYEPSFSPVVPPPELAPVVQPEHAYEPEIPEKPEEGVSVEMPLRASSVAIADEGTAAFCAAPISAASAIPAASILESAAGEAGALPGEAPRLSVGQYFLSLFLMLIPAVGFVLALVYACASSNPEKCALARAVLMVKALFWIIALIAAAGVLVYAQVYRRLPFGG